MVKIVRKLNKNSEYSYSINIPKEIVEKYKWKSKQKLTVEDKGRGSLEIKDWRKNNKILLLKRKVF
ncbi:MAG TPA: hypothetical protein ENJ27_00250 [Candidatus Moranbacteria bacterium]|nr:hypothetical protein [Candidatus Moranbacteria bacterium]